MIRILLTRAMFYAGMLGIPICGMLIQMQAFVFQLSPARQFCVVAVSTVLVIETFKALRRRMKRWETEVEIPFVIATIWKDADADDREALMRKAREHNPELFEKAKSTYERIKRQK